MQLGVQQNHLGGHIWYRSSNPVKKRRHSTYTFHWPSHSVVGSSRSERSTWIRVLRRRIGKKEWRPKPKRPTLQIDGSKRMRYPPETGGNIYMFMLMVTSWKQTLSTALIRYGSLYYTPPPYKRTGEKQEGGPILEQDRTGDNFLVFFRTGDNF